MRISVVSLTGCQTLFPNRLLITIVIVFEGFNIHDFLDLSTGFGDKKVKKFFHIRDKAGAIEVNDISYGQVVESIKLFGVANEIKVKEKLGFGRDLRVVLKSIDHLMLFGASFHGIEFDRFDPTLPVKVIILVKTCSLLPLRSSV